MRGHHLFLLLLALLLPVLWGARSEALEITSVSPSEATPGSVVSVSGSSFGEGVRVQLGPRSISPDGIRRDRLLFTVPELPEGEYTLTLVRGDRASSRSFLLRVVAPAPNIRSVEPSNIDICSARGDLEVTVQGSNFLPGASLLLNGKAVAHSRASANAISFTPPVLEAGVYGVEVVNPDGRSSLPHSLYFNSVPEIQAVSRGEDFVNAYQLVIEGKNFFFNSTLVVTEYPGDFSGLSPNQRTLVGRSESEGNLDRLPGRTQSDLLRYVDCTRIIYKRFPYSEQDKEITLQVINPDGKASSTYSISAP